MAAGPEALLWQAMRRSMPKTYLAHRIENRAGGGIPDVKLLIDGYHLEIELKVPVRNFVKLSSHQIAYLYSYSRAKGCCFVLAKSPGSRIIHLFSGSLAVELAERPMSEVQGSTFESFDALWGGLRSLVLDHYAALRPCGG
jgi:Holliday junction resolvase